MFDTARTSDDAGLMTQLRALNWLSASQQQRLMTAMVVDQVERGGVIFSDERGAGRDVFILLSGAARLTAVNGKRRRTVLALFPPGILRRPPSLAGCSGLRCEALRASRVARISRDVLVKIALGAGVPNFDQVVTLLYGGLDNLLTRYAGYAGFDLRARVAIALLELGAAFGARDSRGMVLTINPTQQDLADLVGASRPKVSMVLNEFVRDGAIDRAGRHIALIPSRLEAIVQSRYWTT
jgi:CRP/FNR family transcriptional regulator, cyclic AMP receptor protein